MNDIRDSRHQITIAEASRKRTLGIAFAELALTACLVVSIVIVLMAASASGVMAATRSDLIMMEENSTTTLTTAAILTVIAVVMGALTILALRDVAPVHSKRGARRTTTTSRR